MLHQCGCHQVDTKEQKYYTESELNFVFSDSVKENDFYFA
jgi:hypothetical protein